MGGFPSDFERKARDYFTVFCDSTDWQDAVPEEMWPHVIVSPAEQSGVWFAALERIKRRRWLLLGSVDRDETGAREILTLTVEPFEHAAAVTGDLMRRLRLGRVRQEVEARMRDWQDAIVTDAAAMFTTETQRRVEQEAVAQGRQRVRWPDEHYREVALAYLDECKRGTRNIRAALGALYGKQPETIRDWIHRARELGYLPREGKAGRVSCKPGPRLLAEMKEAADAQR